MTLAEGIRTRLIKQFGVGAGTGQFKLWPVISVNE